MSLIHWWPLNGNTNDLGLNPTSLTNNGAIVNNIGKIGSCYYLSASSGFVGAFNTNALMHGACSFSLWIKIPETEYKARVSDFTYDSDHILMNSRVFGTNNSYTDTGLCLALQTNNIYSSGSVSSISLYMGWRDSNSAPIFEPYTITFNTWYHVVITKDVSGKMIMYINGLKVKGPLQASANAFAESNFYINTGAVWGSGNYRNSNAPMYLNDFRIYDHSLSAKEVKEISKGLVLHYNFEDEYIEPTTNIDPARSTAPSFSFAATKEKVIFKGKECWHFIIENNGSIWSYSSATGYAENSILTRSCWLYIPSGQTNRAGWYGLPFAFEGMKSISNRRVYDLNKMDTWQHCYCTGTAQSTSSNYLLYMLADGSTTAHRIEFYITDIQLEQKDHATPYVNGTRSAGKVYDNSGYGNNGIINGDCQIISQTNSGIHSLFNNSTNVGTSTSSGAAYIKGTLVSPWSPEQLTISFWAKIIDYHYQNSGILSLSNNSSYPNDYIQAGVHQFDDVFWFTFTETYANLSSTSLIETDVWHHYVLVYNGSSVISYRDGIKIQEVTSASGNINSFQYIYLGLNVAGGAWRQSKENWADFKLYSTALSAEDIKAEYNRKAAIDKNGNLFTGEIIETTYNLLTSENLFNGRVNTSATSNVGEIVARNNYSAYRISPAAYWSGDEATSQNICKGQFGSGQYIFDLWIDVDEVYYDGIGQWVPGGFAVYYTDGSVDNVVIDANSTQGHSGYQHLIRKTNVNKTISGLGVYYYIGVPVYIRCDSVICKVNSDGKICKNNIIAGGQFVEPAVSDSKCKLTRYGVVSNAIKEL